MQLSPESHSGYEARAYKDAIISISVYSRRVCCTVREAIFFLLNIILSVALIFIIPFMLPIIRIIS